MRSQMSRPLKHIRSAKGPTMKVIKTGNQSLVSGPPKDIRSNERLIIKAIRNSKVLGNLRSLSLPDEWLPSNKYCITYVVLKQL